MANVRPNSILLADDSQTFLMYVGILIKRLGYKTYLARDGVEAIKLAKEKKPSIIVLDYVMPKIDGTSCLSIIRSDPDLRETPVIILTAQDTVREEFEKLGCCYFLKKPVNVSEFHSALRACLTVHNERKNIRASIKLRAVIECHDERRELYATSISEEGMFLRTIAPFEKGTEMDIVFSVDHEDPVELRGQVIYSNSLASEIVPEPGMGIQFFSVPEDVKSRISHYVMREIVHDLCTEEKHIYCDNGFDESFL